MLQTRCLILYRPNVLSWDYGILLQLSGLRSYLLLFLPLFNGQLPLLNHHTERGCSSA